MVDQSVAAARIWKTGTRRGIVYVEGRERAERVLAAAGYGGMALIKPSKEQILPGSMAVYSDRRGRPFAWQIPFDIKHWGEVVSAAGIDEA